MREDVVEQLLQRRVRYQRKVAILMTLAVIGVAGVFIASFLLDNVLPIVAFAAASAGLILADSVFSWVGAWKVARSLAERRAELEAEPYRVLAGD